MVSILRLIPGTHRISCLRLPLVVLSPQVVYGLTILFIYMNNFSVFLSLLFCFAGELKELWMCEMVTVLARGVGTCIARHPSGVPNDIRFPILFLGCYSYCSAYCKTIFAAEMHCWCRWRSRIAALKAVRTIGAVACPSGASTMPMQEMGTSWSLAVTMTVGTQRASTMTTYTHHPGSVYGRGDVCMWSSYWPAGCPQSW